MTHLVSGRQCNGVGPTNGVKKSSLPLWAVMPGLIYIVIIDLLTVTGMIGFHPWIVQTWSIVLFVLPWVTLLVVRRSPSAYGYTSNRAIAEFGWGMVAGSVWRGLSMGFNLWWQGGWTQIGWGAVYWLGGIVLVPLVEETFFRGYLGRALASRVGRWPAILIQTILFSLHPGHWAQGYLHLVSIFIFGLITGWLVERRGSIWAAWGAHGFANVLPGIIRFFI